MLPSPVRSANTAIRSILELLSITVRQGLETQDASPVPLAVLKHIGTLTKAIHLVEAASAAAVQRERSREKGRAKRLEAAGEKLHAALQAHPVAIDSMTESGQDLIQQLSSNPCPCGGSADLVYSVPYPPMYQVCCVACGRLGPLAREPRHAVQEWSHKLATERARIETLEAELDASASKRPERDEVAMKAVDAALDVAASTVEPTPTTPLRKDPAAPTVTPPWKHE